MELGTTTVTISTTDGKAQLEGELLMGLTSTAIILTHPMPMLGGSMRNNVLHHGVKVF